MHLLQYNLLSSLGVWNKDVGAASQTLLTQVKLCLMQPREIVTTSFNTTQEGGVLLENGGGVLPSSSNPDPISQQKMSFFRPGL